MPKTREYILYYKITQRVKKKNILLMIPSSEGCYCIAVSNFPVLLRGVTPKIMVVFIA